MCVVNKHTKFTEGIIDHLVGELGCAYADNCFTAKETLMATYYRGKCIEEAQFRMGTLIALGSTCEEFQRRCPSGPSGGDFFLLFLRPVIVNFLIILLYKF
jgi:hypothetical protein